GLNVSPNCEIRWPGRHVFSSKIGSTLQRSRRSSLRTLSKSSRQPKAPCLAVRSVTRRHADRSEREGRSVAGLSHRRRRQERHDVVVLLLAAAPRPIPFGDQGAWFSVLCG